MELFELFLIIRGDFSGSAFAVLESGWFPE